MNEVAEAAARLPIDHLSVSSLNTYLRCPERWRRRYMEHEFEAVVGVGLVLGSASGAAHNANFRQKSMSMEDLPTDDVLDAFSDAFEEQREQREDIDWGREKPGEAKDSGALAVQVFHEERSPEIQPVTIERKFSLEFDGQPWTFDGYIDIETDDSVVRDLKLVSKRMSQADADKDPQATSYLAARRAEGNPAEGFTFESAVRKKAPEAVAVPTSRTDLQLDNFQGRVLQLAAEISWRIESGNWGYAAPGAWWCSEGWCGFWDSCPAGGLK